MAVDAADPSPRSDPRTRRLPRLLVVLLAPVLLTWVPAQTVRSAGPVIDLSHAMAINTGHARAPAGTGRFLLTSVREEHDPLWLWATRMLLQPGRADPGGSAAGPLNTLSQMQEAKAYAWEVAVDLALSPTDRDSIAQFALSPSAREMPDVNTEGITGPSGGLMLALAFTDTLNHGDLTAGRSIAGTGTIDWNGTVGDIGYVAYKVRGAAAAGASVFFVPWGNLAEARRAAPKSIQVVPVATFTDALSWLCHQGTRDTACVKLDNRAGA